MIRRLFPLVVVGFASSLFTVGLMSAMGQAGPTIPANIKARAFQMVDAGGRVRGEMKMVSGKPTIRLLHPGGDVRLSLDLTRNEPRVSFFGDGDTRRMVMSVFDDLPAIDLYRSSGDLSATFDIDQDRPLLSFYDSARTNRVTLGMANNGPLLAFADFAGLPRMAIGQTGTEGPQIELLNAFGDTGTLIGQDVNGAPVFSMFSPFDSNFISHRVGSRFGYTIYRVNGSQEIVP